MRLDSETIHLRIAELLKLRRRFVVATITEIKGSCPQRAGTRMIIHPNREFEFTIGGGAFEAEVIHDAAELVDQEAPSHREYKLTKPEMGMYCQGLIKVMFEAYRPRPRLMIFGGGHVGQALSRLSAATNLFETIVIDDRAVYADSQKHPQADRVILTDREFMKDVPEIDPESYLVVVTRCHATDRMLVERYLSSNAAYIGLIGSRSKIRQFRHELAQNGLPEDLLDRLHAPIGLSIGAKDPAEVAISILAELIQVKNTAKSTASLLKVSSPPAS